MALDRVLRAGLREAERHARAKNFMHCIDLMEYVQPIPFMALADDEELPTLVEEYMNQLLVPTLRPSDAPMFFRALADFRIAYTAFWL